MKFCAKCGTELPESAIYCTKCGTKSQENLISKSLLASLKAKNTNFKSLSPKTASLIKKPKILVTIVASTAALVLVAVGVVVLVPRSLPMELTLSSFDDVTFNSDCRPMVSENQDLDSAVQITFIGDDVAQKKPNPVKGKWSIGKNQTCKFTSTVQVPSDAKTYSLDLVTNGGKTPIAKSLIMDGSISEIVIESDVTKYLTIKGSLDLFVSVSSTTLENCRNDYVFILGGVCGSMRIISVNKCSGAGGYSDIGEGPVVRVSTSNDSELGIGRFDEGVGALFGDWEFEDGEWTGKCTFSWTIEVPEVTSDYRVGIKDRGERSYPYSEIKDLNGEINLVLGP